MDTNVLVSALIKPNGLPRLVLDYAMDNESILFSEATFSELLSVLQRDRVRRFIHAQSERSTLELLRKISTFIAVHLTIDACRDASDNKYLELAVAGGADAIVTGNVRDFIADQF